MFWQPVRWSSSESKWVVSHHYFDGIILWLLTWLVNYVTMLLVVCQLSCDVIGYEDLSNYFWNDSWIQTFHSYTKQLVKIALSTLLRLCKWASVYERCLSCRVRGCNGCTLTPPSSSPPPHRLRRSAFMLTNNFKRSELMKKISQHISFLTSLCVVNYYSSILFNCHYYTKKYTRYNTIPTINLHYKNLSLG